MILLKKYTSLLFVLGFFVLFTTGAYSQEAPKQIADIVINNDSRTKETVIKAQLPFKVGDIWTEELKKLSKERLIQLNIFKEDSLKVFAKKMDTAKIRVIINCSDRNIFIDDWIEFSATKVLNVLATQELAHTIRNPFGNGINLSGKMKWTNSEVNKDNILKKEAKKLNTEHETGWLIDIDYPGKLGRVYSLSHEKFKGKRKFNNEAYITNGSRNKVSLNQIITSNSELNYSLLYQQNSYYSNSQMKKDQEYLIIGGSLAKGKVNVGDMDFVLDDYFKIAVDYGISLKDEYEDFQRLTLNLDKVYQINKDNFVYSIKGGLSPESIPLNYKFKGGGYSKLDGGVPFRGHNYNMATSKYLLTSLEYHKRFLYDKLWVIPFVDLGNFEGSSWALDGGLGLAYNTPLGPLLRADVGFDLIGNNTTFNFSLGHSF